MKGESNMFNMNTIGKTIREARIRQNMTQMELADQMGVSFQAVSNWERGNSMPDISKLEPLCKVLHLNVQQLLSGQPQSTAAVVKVLTLQEDPLTVEELAEVAPLLPPAQMESETKKASAGKKWDVSKLSKIIPFLDEELLEEICDKVQVVSLKELAGIAPFLDEDTLDKMIMTSGANDWEGVLALAPYLGEHTLDTLALRCLSNADGHDLSELAPFLSEETLSKIAVTLEPDSKTLTSLAPFLNEDALDILVEKRLESGDTTGLSNLYPYLSGDTMRKILKYLLDSDNTDDLEEAAVYL